MPAPWFTLKNLAPRNVGEVAKRAQLSIRGYIGESNENVELMPGFAIEGGGGTVRELERDITALGDVTEIEIFITSEGGSVFDALTIADILNRHPARIIATVEGYAFSAATIIIAKCADEIRMASNAFMMIHLAECCACGNAADIQVVLNLLAKTDTTLSEIYASRGGGTPEEFLALMAEETYLTGTECAARKLADVITDEVVLTNFKPLASLPRNLANKEKMPPVLRALFDTPSIPATPTNSIPTDMTPEEVNALIATANKPLVDANTKLAADLTAATDTITKLKTDVTTQVENATKPLVEANTKLTAELENIKKLHENGIPTAAAGAAPITGAATTTADGEKTLDMKNMSAAQLIAEGRKRQLEKAA